MDESSDTEKSNIMNHTLTQGYRMSFVPECCEFTNIDVIDLNCDPERQLRSQSQYQYQYQGISCIDDRERHIAAMTAYLRDVQQFQRGLLDRDTWGMGVNMRNYIYSSNRRYRDMIKPNRLKGTTGIRNDQTLYSSEVSQMKAISKEVKDLEIRTKNLHTMIGSKNKYEVSLVETLEEFKILTENVNTLFKQLPPSDCNIHKRKLLKEMKKLKFLIQNVCNQYNYGEQHVNEYLEEMNGLISIPREKHHNLTNFDDTNQAIPTSSTKHKMEKNYRGQLIDTMLYNNFMEMQEEDEGNQEHLELITEVGVRLMP